MNVVSRFLLLGIVSGSWCWAAPLTVNNPSFELPAQSPGGFTNGVVTGWTVNNTAGGVWRPAVGPNNGSNFFSSIPNLNQVLFVGFNGLATDVNQSLGIALLPNTTYTLSYFVGQRYDLPLSTYTVALDANSTVLVSDSLGAPTAGNFVMRTIGFNSGPSPVAGTLNIDISATGLKSGASAQAIFDLVTLDASATVPEPATLSFMGLGMFLLVLSHRHFRKTSSSKES